MNNSVEKTLVLNQSYEPLVITGADKAFILIYLNKADLVESHTKPFRSVNNVFPRPSIIRLRKSIKFRMYKTVELTRRNVFKRDNFTCVYCGSHLDLTVDHIIPKSLGGKNTWDNLVTACKLCNNKKDNKLLDETDFNLDYKPSRPHHIMFMGHGLTKVYENWKPYLFLQ